MKFKTLKHKTLPDTFGVFQSHDEGQIRDADTEIYHSAMPELFGIGSTMEDIKAHYICTTAIEQLKDYDLVTVQITVLD